MNHLIKTRTTCLKIISSDYIVLCCTMPKKNKGTSSSDKIKVIESTAKPEAVELDRRGNILINVHCKPGSSVNMIQGELSFPNQPRLDVKVHARAVEGMANTELIAYLADVLDIRKTDISLIHGMKSREKTLSISSDAISLEGIKEKIDKEIALSKGKG